MRRGRDLTGESSDNSNIISFWRKLWRIKAQQKVKIFAWKVFHNAIPVAENLIKRGCGVASECLRCGFKMESATHVFLHCWWSKEFWRHLFGDKRLLELNFESLDEWLWFQVGELDLDELRTLLYGLWWIWFVRNNIWHNHSYWSIEVAASRVKHIVTELANPKYRLVVSSMEASSKWIPPEEGMLKINCDGAYNPSINFAGAGFICRNCRGMVELVGASRELGISSSLMAEIMALDIAMEKAEEQGWVNVIFSLDNSDIVSFLVGCPSKDFCAPERLLSCRKLLDEHDGWRVEHILREANRCADLLALKALNEDWSWSCASAVPKCIDSLVLLDLASVQDCFVPGSV